MKLIKLVKAKLRPPFSTVAGPITATDTNTSVTIPMVSPASVFECEESVGEASAAKVQLIFASTNPIESGRRSSGRAPPHLSEIRQVEVLRVRNAILTHVDVEDAGEDFAFDFDLDPESVATGLGEGVREGDAIGFSSAVCP